MPIVLLSFKKNENGRVMFHGFLAPGDTDAKRDLEGHARICPQFGPAHKNGETIDRYIDVESIPEFDERSIDRWVDEMFDTEDDDEIDTDIEEDDEEDDDEEEDDEY